MNDLVKILKTDPDDVINWARGVKAEEAMDVALDLLHEARHMDNSIVWLNAVIGARELIDKTKKELKHYKKSYEEELSLAEGYEKKIKAIHELSEKFHGESHEKYQGIMGCPVCAAKIVRRDIKI